MHTMIFDFKNDLLIIPFDVFEELGEPLEFNYLLNRALGLFGVTGEKDRSSLPWGNRFSPRKSRIQKYRDDEAGHYVIEASSVAMRRLSEYFPDYEDGAAYLLLGTKPDSMNAVFFDLTNARRFDNDISAR